MTNSVDAFDACVALAVSLFVSSEERFPTVKTLVAKFDNEVDLVAAAELAMNQYSESNFRIGDIKQQVKRSLMGSVMRDLASHQQC